MEESLQCVGRVSSALWEFLPVLKEDALECKEDRGESIHSVGENDVVLHALVKGASGLTQAPKNQKSGQPPL